jgi:SAM-dependent methyltransferase
VTDRWAAWLRIRRDGGSEKQRRRTLAALASIRDELLDAAGVGRGDVVLDVGCGDGLIGLAALERGAEVIFSDISEACLDDCRAVAGAAARFHLATATDLGDIEADVVIARSVLIYVADKRQAFSEFFRVLRPGGRLAIFEPINRFGMDERRTTYGFRKIVGVEELLARVIREIDRTPVSAAMIGFDERDLLRLAEAAGFVDLHLRFLAEVTERPMWTARSWDVFADSSPNPLAPTFREAMTSALSPAEAHRLTTVLRPQIEQGIGTTRMARAYLVGRKPGARPNTLSDGPISARSE